MSIEINLLPQEYRVQERTPLGLILTIVLGMLTVGAIGIYGIDLRNRLSAETARNLSLTAERERLTLEAAQIEKLHRSIETAKRRQDAIIDISQSKIVWSQKLIEFGRILASYPDFWIDRLTLARGGAGAGTLTMNFLAAGNLTNVAQFRERLMGDTSFWYHFDHIDAPRITNTDKGGQLATYGYTGVVTNFNCSLPLK